MLKVFGIFSNSLFAEYLMRMIFIRIPVYREDVGSEKPGFAEGVSYEKSKFKSSC